MTREIYPVTADGKKRCTKCSYLKPVSEFSPSPYYLHRYTSQCKQCKNADTRAKQEAKKSFRLVS